MIPLAGGPRHAVPNRPVLPGALLARRAKIFAGWLPAAAACALGTPAASAEEADARPSYTLVRYDEDYRALRDPTRRRDPWDSLKYLPLWPGRPNSFLSLGGEVRETYEILRNDGLGAAPRDRDGYWLQRVMLHADVHLGEHVRLWAQVKSAVELGRAGGARPVDRDDLDLNQLFVDFSWPLALGPAGSSWTLRLGRQELDFGDQRVLAVREGPNDRQSFDAARLTVRLGQSATTDFFGGRTDSDERGVFDNDPIAARSTVWGVYSTFDLTGRFHALPAGAKAGLDLFYFGYKAGESVYARGAGGEARHTLGLRCFGSLPLGPPTREDKGSRPLPGTTLDYNFLLAGQAGSFGPADIRAWRAATDLGVTFAAWPLQPRLGLTAQISSGDRRPGSRTLGAFNAPFEAGFRYGGVLNEQFGAPNLRLLQPQLLLHLPGSVTLELKGLLAWRDHTRDGLYNVPGFLIRDGRATSARHVGSVPEVTVNWQANRHLSFTVNYYHLFAGPFIERGIPAGRSVDGLSAWATFKF